MFSTRGEMVDRRAGRVGAEPSTEPVSTFSVVDESSLTASELLAAVGVVSARELQASDARLLGAVADLVAAGRCESVSVDGEECFELVEVVAHRVLRNLDEARRSELRLASATLRESLGLLDCGLEDAWRRRDWTACGRIIDRWWPQLSFSSFRPLSQRVMSAMPVEALRAWPGAWHRAEYNGMLPLGEAPVVLPSSQSQIREWCRTGEAWIALRRAAIAMLSRRVHQRFEEARDLALRARPLADAVGWSANGVSRGFCAFWFLHAGISHELAGDLAAAGRSYRASWAARDSDELGFCARDAAGKLAALAALQGDYEEASSWLAETRRLEPTELWVAPHIETAIEVAELMLAIDALDPEESRRHDDVLARPVHREGHWSASAFARARRLVTWGQPHEALTLLDAAAHDDVRVLTGLHRSLWGTARVDALLAAGQATRAATALVDIEGTGFGFGSSARLQLLAGRPAEARVQVALATEGSLWPRQRTELMVIDAAAALALDDAPAAAQSMARAVARIRRGGFLHVLATVPRHVLTELTPAVPELEDLIEQLEQSGIAPIYPERVELVSISPRESAVLQSLAAGRTLAGTALHLVVSTNTVKTQVRSLYQKLDVHDRQELLLCAGRLGLLPDV